jgi:alpha-glucosidase
LLTIMTPIRAAAVFAFTLMLVGSALASPLTLVSPNGEVTVDFDIKELPQPYLPGKRAYYRVLYKHTQLLLDSPLGLTFIGMPAFGEDLEIIGTSSEEHSSTWEDALGTRRTVPDRYRELTVRLRQKRKPFLMLNVVFRAYNEGIAFRYEIPKQDSVGRFKISSENTGFFFGHDGMAYALNLGRYNTNYEGTYEPVQLSDIQPDSIIGVPLLVHPSEGVWAAILEADLENYGGMYLGGTRGAFTWLTTKISPHEDRVDVVAVGSTPARTPWRVVLVNANPGGLIESDYLMLNLNPPSRIEDASWITSGNAVWDNDPFDKSTETMKHYIDFASSHGIPYLLTDVGWAKKDLETPTKGVHPDQWAQILPELGWSPVEDLMHPIPKIDMPEVLAYAKQKHVKVMLWIHWTSARDQMEKVFPFYEHMGLAGFKVDFMNDVPDDQTTVKFYHDLTQLAAEHHLVIDFHGAYKPTGLRRTYPNLITREAVMGLEYNSVSSQAGPEHEVTLPFTRMLAGPMDYTPGCFNNATKEQFKPGKGMCQGTRAHQLAMYVVFFSPIQMIDATLAEIQNAQGFEFIENVPAVWDETKVIAGEPGKFIIVARRAKDVWYLGGMTNWGARDVDVPVAFLSGLPYQLKLFTDGPHADRDAKELRIGTQRISSASTITIHMAPGGGFAAILTPEKQ